MTYGVLDLAARQLVYARAGHTPLIYRRADSGGRPVDILTPDGLVLGLRIDDGEMFERCCWRTRCRSSAATCCCSSPTGSARR